MLAEQSMLQPWWKQGGWKSAIHLYIVLHGCSEINVPVCVVPCVNCRVGNRNYIE